jgi:hypothetical protein
MSAEVKPAGPAPTIMVFAGMGAERSGDMELMGKGLMGKRGNALDFRAETAARLHPSSNGPKSL